MSIPSIYSQCNSGGMTPTDRKPSWTENELLAGSAGATLVIYKPRNIKHQQNSRQNEDRDKTKVRQNENKDYCCIFLWHPKEFSFFRLYLPAADREHWHWKIIKFFRLAAKAVKLSRLRTRSARRCGTTWRLWFHKRRDKAIVSERPLQGETISAGWDYGCSALSKPLLMFLLKELG